VTKDAGTVRHGIVVRIDIFGDRLEPSAVTWQYDNVRAGGVGDKRSPRRDVDVVKAKE
jgi:hypothetical protein